MYHTFNLEAFFFNAKTDYLPYYKHFTVTLEGGETSKKLLEAVKEQNENFAYPTEKLLFRLNGVVCTGTETLDNIVLKLGTDLKIEPVQSYRSNHCLIINDDDFSQAFELLSEFCDDADKEYFDSLYALHYASATFDYDKSYKGDAVIALAHHLAKKYPEHRNAVANAIKEPLLMCEYENMLFEPYDLQPALDTLRSEVSESTDIFSRIKARFMNTSEGISVSKVSIHQKNVALYGTREENLIRTLEEKNARYVSFPTALRLNGRSILATAPELALKKAAVILLDALDHGAEVVVCKDEADARYFIENFKAIERAAGRDIPLCVTSVSALGLPASEVAA
jgi:hypothetical protein